MDIFTTEQAIKKMNCGCIMKCISDDCLNNHRIYKSQTGYIDADYDDETMLIQEEDLKTITGDWVVSHMNPNEYRCTICKIIWEKGWCDDEAKQELKDNFGNFSVDECEVVCDDCYNGLDMVYPFVDFKAQYSN